MQLNIFQTIRTIRFQPFTVLQYSFDLPQVTRNLISSAVNFEYDQPHELKSQNVRKFGNVRTIYKLFRDLPQWETDPLEMAPINSFFKPCVSCIIVNLQLPLLNLVIFSSFFKFLLKYVLHFHFLLGKSGRHLAPWNLNLKPFIKYLIHL